MSYHYNILMVRARFTARTCQNWRVRYRRWKITCQALRPQVSAGMCIIGEFAWPRMLVRSPRPPVDDDRPRAHGRAQRGGVITPSPLRRRPPGCSPSRPSGRGGAHARACAESGSPPGSRSKAPGASTRMLARLPRQVRVPESSDRQTKSLLE